MAVRRNLFIQLARPGAVIAGAWAIALGFYAPWVTAPAWSLTGWELSNLVRLGGPVAALVLSLDVLPYAGAAHLLSALPYLGLLGLSLQAIALAHPGARWVALSLVVVAGLPVLAVHIAAAVGALALLPGVPALSELGPLGVGAGLLVGLVGALSVIVGAGLQLALPGQPTEAPGAFPAIEIPAVRPAEAPGPEPGITFPVRSVSLAIFVAAGLGAAAISLAFPPAGPPPSASLATGFLPPSTSAYLSLRLPIKPSQLWSLLKTGPPELQVALNGAENAAKEAGYDLERDILGLLGSEAQLGVIGATDESPRGLLAAVSVTGQELPEQVLVGLLGREAHRLGQQLSEREYRGRRVFELPQAGLAAAVSDGHLLLADDATVLARAIDTRKDGGASLTDSPPFRRAQSALPPAALAFFYLNTAGLIRDPVFKSMTNALPSPTGPASQLLGPGTQPAALAEAVPGYVESLGIALSVIAEGLRLDYIAVRPATVRAEPWPTTTLRGASLLPYDTALYYSGQDLRRVWTLVKGALPRGLPIPGAPAPGQDLVAAANAALGVDLERDLFSWTSGEYNLALLPGASNQVPHGLVLIQAPANGAEEKLVLASKATQRATGARFREERVGGTRAYAAQPSGGGYAMLGGFAVAANSRDSLAGAVAVREGREPSLADTEAFRGVRAHMPGDSNGLLYVNVQEGKRLLGWQAGLEGTRALALGWGDDGRSAYGRLFVLFEPGGGRSLLDGLRGLFGIKLFADGQASAPGLPLPGAVSSPYKLTAGTPAPDLALQSLDGRTLSLRDFRGKTVVVNFWATWCPPCRSEMPDLEQIYSERKDQLVVLAINIQEAPEPVHKFVAQYGLTFPILMDTNGDVKGSFAVQSLPTTFFVDKEGKVAAFNTGPLNKSAIAKKLELVPQ